MSVDKHAVKGRKVEGQCHLQIYDCRMLTEEEIKEVEVGDVH